MAVHGMYLSNIGRQCPLSLALLTRIQATIRRTFGISSAQSLKTSGVHAARSAAVWAELGVGNAMTQTATPRTYPSLLTLADDLICLVPTSISFLCGRLLWTSVFDVHRAIPIGLQPLV